MKKHLLYEPTEIIKETEKAVCIKRKDLTDTMVEALKFNMMLPNKYRLFVKGGNFWIPKSQIDIENNKIIAITKWMYNQLIMFIDCPICLQEDIGAVDAIEKKYSSQIGKRIAIESKINSEINKGRN